MSRKFEHELGCRAKDKITGFTGIIVARTEHLMNCNVYGIKPESLHEGKPMDCQWFDEPQVEVVQSGVHKTHQETGGPTENPKY